MSAGPAVEFDLDMRLADLWAQVSDDPKDWSIRMWGDFLRCAYGMGYCDALKENADGQLGKLCRDHGYALPKARNT